jgi:hypothetical protein
MTAIEQLVMPDLREMGRLLRLIQENFARKL